MIKRTKILLSLTAAIVIIIFVFFINSILKALMPIYRPALPALLSGPSRRHTVYRENAVSRPLEIPPSSPDRDNPSQVPCARLI